MASYLHPGVYVEEIPSGSKPIEGVATSVAAFVGPAVRGPAGSAELVHSFGEYETLYGPIHSETDVMGLAVASFFANGGRDAYICRVVGPAPPAKAAHFEVAGQNAADVISILATSVGGWGNEVYIRITKPNATDLTFTLEVGNLDGPEFVVTETYEDLNMDDTSTDYVLTRVNGNSTLVEVALEPAAEPGSASYQQGSLTSAAVDNAADFFSANVVDNMVMTIDIDGLGKHRIDLGPAAGLALAGVNADDGDKIALAITAEVAALEPLLTPFRDFECTYDDMALTFTLTSGEASSSSSVAIRAGDGAATDLADLLLLDPGSNPDSVHGSANVIPVQTLGFNDQGEPLAEGADAAPTQAEYRTFFENILSKKTDASIIVLPGQSVPEVGDNGAISEALAHCESMRNRMLIVDPPPGYEMESGSHVTDLGLTTSTYAVLYYPWLIVNNPHFHEELNATAPKTLTVAPSAAAAGMWSKIDGRRGVWKAPAGVEAQLTAVSDLEFDIGNGEQDQLNPMGVNCLRMMPGYGRVFWGSRTLSTKANPEWRYVPVRRTAIFIEQSVYNGIQWAVFEGNNHLLWSSLRLNIEGFMNGLFRAGAFQGETASQAYFVRCGLGDTMTQGDIDAGQVIVIIGFAPLKPAEFVIIRLTQMVGEQ